MKLNGKHNIITDRDVTITSDQNLGNSLHSVLSRHDIDIEQLKSNVKWIYKYGGVGSGVGGGSSTSKWSIMATLDGKTLQNNELSLTPDVKSYILDIRISGASGSYYVEYSYGGVERSLTLSADNGWRVKRAIELSGNGHITITASDGSLYKSVEADYITTPYIFSDIKFYKSNLTTTWPSSSGDLYMEDGVAEGLVLGCDYSFAINAESKYKWNFLGETYEGVLVNKTDIISLEVPKSLMENKDKAGLYTAQLTIYITPEGQTEIILTKNVSFNLIPSHDLYLKILPANSGESIYDAPQSEEYYKYSVNKNISFQVRAYLGANNNSPCNITYTTSSTTSNEIVAGEFAGIEGQTHILTMRFTTEGWHQVIFTCTMEGQTKSYTKYLYCFKAHSDFTWYNLHGDVLKSSGIGMTSSNYFRVNKDLSTPDFSMTDIISMTANSENRIITWPKSSSVADAGEFAIHIGIQYNSINNVLSNLIGFNCGTNSDSILFSQNKVTLRSPYVTSDSDISWFIPKIFDYDPYYAENYHLLSLVCSKVRYDDTNLNMYYQVCLYIDGILEGAHSTFITSSQFIDSITLYPGNYAINLIDVTHFVYNEQNTPAINDIDVVYYNTTYTSVKNNEPVSAESASIISSFYDNNSGGSKYSINNKLVSISSDLIANIADSSSIPTLVLSRDKNLSEFENGGSVIDWINTSYEQDSSSAGLLHKVKVNLKWGINQLNEIKIDEKYGVNTSFYIQLQGSSTLGNKSKNFTLGLDVDEGITNSVLFSPNYKEDDHATFLPEQMFTLKADVVDSSHSNNTAVGKFVNANNDFNHVQTVLAAQPNTIDEKISNKIKQCLEGFPILLYLELTDKQGSAPEYYYLGVYNFNLGRESYFNLGYCDLSQLNSLKENSSGFTFIEVESVNPLNNFVAGEIQGNNKYWDFSQYHDTILFAFENDKNEYMFGDIVKNSNNVVYKGSIQNFVKSVSRAGGYLFDMIDKDFGDIGTNSNANYHIKNMVPDAKIQYKRNSENKYTPTGENILDFTQNDLHDCINPSEDSEDLRPFLNYESAVYYYTTCMVFGLVDSVQKNLNIKTWNGKTFGLYFYDMDTSLGTSNSGGDTSYFCFSDYWDNVTEIVEHENGDKETILKGVKIYRDYYPIEHEGIIGYDVPSSYLFAICKYTPVDVTYSNYLSPQQIYATWRKPGGVLENAKKFIDNYYGSHLKNVHPALINLNYRNKFLFNTGGDVTAFSNESVGLKGTKVAKTLDWMNGRLHILDAYFNLNQRSVNVSEDPENKRVEPKHTVDNLSQNNDIYVLKDIFSNPANSERSLTRQGPCEFKVTAEAYAPLFVTRAAKESRYLFVDPTVEYTINENFEGQESSNFGGSDLWTSLNSINPFIDTLANKQNFYLNSDKIETIIGDSTSSVSGTWTFVIPSCKTLTLTGKNYRGSLAINSNFYNLQNINISGSGISLTADSANVENINLNNVTSASIRILNCIKLSSTGVTLTNASIDDMYISPAWSKDINLTNNKIKKLTVQGRAENSEFGTLNLPNASTLTELTFNRFSKVIVNNAPKLTKIVCNDSDTEGHLLKELHITNCPNVQNLEIYATGLEVLNLEKCNELKTITLKGLNTSFDKLKILNLSYTKVESIKFIYADGTVEHDETLIDLTKFVNLSTTESNSSYFKLSNNTAVKFIKFSNNLSTPVFIHYPINNCINLERIYGHVTLNCTECFKTCEKFSIHGMDLSTLTWKGQSILDNGRVKMPDEISEIMFQSGSDVTNISLYTTSAYADFMNTSCTIFDYYYFFSNCTNVTSCHSLFENPKNLEWGVFNWTDDVDNSPNRHMFSKTPNITNLSRIFWNNSGNTIRLFTPTDRGVISNDGLFSTLTKLTSISWPFNGYSCYTDRFIFRNSISQYNIESIKGFPISLFVDDINTIDRNNIILNTSNVDTFLNSGNISALFDNLNNVKVICGFPSTTYIDYESSTFTLPSKLTSIESSFRSTYAKGEIKFQDYVGPCKKVLQIINHSFRVTSSIDVLGTTYKAILYIGDDLFAGCEALVHIGYGSLVDSNYSTYNYSESSFNGSGLNKVIVGDTFPYTIFKQSGSTKFTHLSGVFMNANSNNTYDNLVLPGDMFEGLNQLENISGIFYDIQHDYMLSSPDKFSNFKACSNLKNVSYAFAQSSYIGSIQPIPRLTGSIPNKFFYHGGTTITVANRKGAENVETTYVYDDQGVVTDTTITVTGEFDIPGFTYESPYKTIEDISYCFAHSNLDQYIKDVSEYKEGDIEYNPTYAPANWLYNNYLSRWEKNNNIDTNKYTDIWVYDGLNRYEMNDCQQLDVHEGTILSGYVNISIDGDDNDNISDTLNYIAPPDLLRYCNSSANIAGLFAYSGVRGWSKQYNGAGVSKYNFGIKGRICPYMLLPVSNTRNIDYLFASCKCLTYYYDSESKIAYTIPKEFFSYAQNITSLRGTFSDLILPQNIDVAVFDYLKLPLNIQDLFYTSYWDGNVENPVIIDSVFAKHQIISTNRAFSIDDSDNDQINRIRKQYIVFRSVFKNTYAESIYNNNTNYANTFRGYSSESIMHEDPKTLPDNSITNNYKTWG